MVHCPKCLTPTASDFGVVICENCGSVYSIDLSGKASLTSSSQPAQPPPVESPPRPQSLPNDIQRAEKTVIFTMDEVETQPPPQPPVPTSPPPPIYQPIEQLKLDPLPNFEPVLSEPHFRDVAKAGESPTPLGPEIYNLKIQGFNDPQIKSEIEDTLLDPKFCFDVKAIKSALAMNHIELTGLNLVKLKVLVAKLKSYSDTGGVQMSWSQNENKNTP